MGYLRHFLAPLVLLLVSSCQPAFAADNCETVTRAKIDEVIAIVRSGLYPQAQVLTGRRLPPFLVEVGLPSNVFAVALIENLLVTAAQRGAAYIACRYEIDARGVALFRKYAEAAT